MRKRSEPVPGADKYYVFTGRIASIASTHGVNNIEKIERNPIKRAICGGDCHFAVYHVFINPTLNIYMLCK